MTIEHFKTKLENTPKTITFVETIAVIDNYYNFKPTAFKNGNLENAEGQNLGSCKIFAFAKKEALTKTETLACFGEFYFKDVLNNPKGNGHLNIRNFMETGFSGLSFAINPLSKK